MRFDILMAVVGLAICLLIDLYTARAIRKRATRHKRTLTTAFIATALAGYLSLAAAWILSSHTSTNDALVAVMWLIFIFMTMLLGKLTFCVVDLLASIPLIFKHRRIKAISLAGAVIATVVFLAMWWGALINRNRIAVTETTVEMSGLPAEFNGYRIAQISDLHVGTWGSDTTFLSKLVDRINGLNSDLIVFTGDIVNRQSNEFEPMVTTFSRLKATDGVYAILGNHDYGDYRRWNREEEHQADRKNLQRLYEETGHRLLLNETAFIHRGNDSIALIGVENIGEPPFSVYGNLDVAYPHTNDSTTKILLTHNPAHWTADIKNNPDKNIGLTLSGHTHAMQIQIAGKSPSSLRYATPHGLYIDSLGHNLYVNRGSGTVGMPMRVGATPEISVLTLTTANNNQAQ